MTTKKYALIVGEDVFGTIQFESDPEKNINGPRLAAGFSSNPTVIEIDPESDIEFGWTWDGTNFIKPGE
jgi:hypothetical protein